MLGSCGYCSTSAHASCSAASAYHAAEGETLLAQRLLLLIDWLSVSASPQPQPRPARIKQQGQGSAHRREEPSAQSDAHLGLLVLRFYFMNIVHFDQIIRRHIRDDLILGCSWYMFAQQVSRKHFASGVKGVQHSGHWLRSTSRNMSQRRSRSTVQSTSPSRPRWPESVGSSAGSASRKKASACPNRHARGVLNRHRPSLVCLTAARRTQGAG